MSLSEQNRALIERELDPINLGIVDALYSLSMLNHLLDAARAEGVAALQQAGEQFAENANCSWRPIETAPKDGTSVLAVVTYAPPHRYFGSWRYGLIEWEPNTWDEAGGSWGRDGIGCTPTQWTPITPPLPQQTALVEEGVEKIIGPHEPAACGASAPSEPPLSAEEVELPNYWRAVVGDTYKPAVLRNVKHMHPTTVKEVFDRYAGTDVADVIAGLIFKNQIANNRSEFFAEEYAKATASPPTPADGGEG